MAGAAATGLGGNAGPELMDRQSTGDKKRDALINECSKDAHDQFFKSFGYCDAGADGDEVRIGVEPAYMHENLKMISINRVKERSSFVTGRAFGPWGTGMRSTERRYGDYKRQGKFVKFIDKWHPKLFSNTT